MCFYNLLFIARASLLKVGLPAWSGHCHRRQLTGGPADALSGDLFGFPAICFAQGLVLA